MGRLIPDLVSLFLVVFIHGLSWIPAIALGEMLWASGSLAVRAITVPISCFVFLTCYCVVDGLARRLLIGRLPTGEFKFGADKEATRWRLSMVFVVTSENLFYGNIHYYTFLKYLFYNLAGGSVAYDNLVAVDARIYEPDQISLGPRCVVGRTAVLTSHVVPRDRKTMHLIPIKVGSDCIIGAGAILLSGVTIGNEVLVGANTTIGMSVTIHDGSVVLPNSYVASNKVIPPREVWGGVPAKFVKKRDECST